MQVEKICDCQSANKDKCKENGDEMDPELKALINKTAKREGFTTYTTLVKNLTPDGSNFLGVLTEVTIQDTLNNRTLNLFIKSIIPSAENIKMISVPDAYSTEIYLYLELSKVLEKLQADALIPSEERYKFVKSYRESTSKHIIMENMVKQGFGTWNRFDVISLEFAEKAIKMLAKFHALGFVLREKQPKYYEDNIKPLKYLFSINEEFTTFFMRMADNAFDYLEASARSKLENYITTLLEKGDKYITDRDSTLTLCHGDYRPNNILINVVEGEITETVPLDYQFINHGSPLIDLLYFIYGATDREFRRKHMDYLQNLYHDTIKNFLKYFDMDVQKYYPKEEFERLFKERLDFGLFIGIWYLQGNLAQKDHIVDLSKCQMSEAEFGKNDLTKVRMQGMVDEFIELGYL